MSRAAAHELDTSTPTEPSAAASVAAPDQPRSEALASTIAATITATITAIKDDARRDPQGYLARTVVPEGGE